ncbi:MAG: thiaminase II [Thermoprotei archaeon]|nr:MAG: thiaminase II [Thermoprotei archaeon]
MSELTSLLRKEADPIWRKIFEHPFVIELYKGTLPLEKFKYYVIQDYNYLIGMLRAYSLAAAKADYDVARLAIEIAYLDATIEMDNYIKLLGKLGLRLEDVINTEPAPTNTAYMNFLIVTCALGTPLECLVSTLPCFWSYMEIAKTHEDLLKENKNQLYRSWAEVYLTKEYTELVERLKNAVNKLWDGTNYDKLKKLFIMGSRYEWMFWDMAYKMEKWPI